MTGNLMDSLRDRADGRLLVRLPNWVGDAVMALPATEALRRSVTGWQLAAAARPWVGEVATMAGIGSVVLDHHRGIHAGPAGRLRLAREYSEGRFDAVVLFPNSFGSALVAALARIPRRGGYSCDLRGFLLTDAVPCASGRDGVRHQVHRYLDLVRTLGFTAAVDPVPRLSVAPRAAADGSFVVFAPGAAYGPAKMWPAIRYAELGRRLIRRGLRVILLGSASERGICSEVAAGIGEAAENLAGRTTLREAAALLAGTGLAVSNDSGLMHLAAAVGAPLVALFGSTDPGDTGPLSERSVVLRGEADCAPCFRRRCPRRLECFDSLTVDRVEEACERALALGTGPA